MRNLRGPGPLFASLFVLGALALSGCEGAIGGGSNGVNPGAPGQGASANSGGSAGGPDSGGSGGGVGVVSGEFSRLTRVEYAGTISQAFGISPDLSATPVDGRIGPFTSNGSASMDPVHPYLLTAEDLAAALIPSELPACESAASDCIAESYRGPLERLYRRPLSELELSTFSALIERLVTEGLPAVDATRALLVSAFLSPDFLFRTSPLAGDAEARARRLAEHLSYALWDAPPDAELGAAATGTALELGERLGAQATRLSADSRATPVLARFIAQWLHVDTDLRLENPDFASSPRFLEFIAYVEDALANDVPVTSFISGERGFVHQDNLEAYGLDSVEPPAGSEIATVSWPADSARRGVLGQDLFADATRHPDPSRRPIFRGLLVQRSLLCQEIPAPNAELIALAGEVGDRTQDQRCASCHLMLDPIGKAFASLDPDDAGGAVPAEVIGHAELAGTYETLPALLEAVAGSRAFAECFARHWLAFFLEQAPDDTDAAWVGQLADDIEAGKSLGAVVESTIQTLAVRTETTEPWCTNP